MIDIELRLFGNLRQYLEGIELGKGYIMKLDDGSTIRVVINSLGIPADIIKIILVNGRPKKLDNILFDSDRLAIFPPIAGG